MLQLNEQRQRQSVLASLPNSRFRSSRNRGLPVKRASCCGSWVTCWSRLVCALSTATHPSTCAIGMPKPKPW